MNNPNDPENLIIFSKENMNPQPTRKKVLMSSEIKTKMTAEDWDNKFHELLDSFLIEVPPNFSMKRISTSMTQKIWQKFSPS
jgi:hypothetical protein